MKIETTIRILANDDEPIAFGKIVTPLEDEEGSGPEHPTVKMRSIATVVKQQIWEDSK